MKLTVQACIRRRTGFTLDVAFTCDTPALGITGPSGSGKSTLLDAIAGIEPGGRVIQDGDDCSRLPLHRRHIGYVTQDALLFPHLSVRDNLRYSPRAGEIETVSEIFGLTPLLDRMPRHLSGGERRRVALARALLSRPRALLLDEPFGGLDEARRREAMAALQRAHRRFHIPLILVSHRADDLRGLTEWVLRLENGRIATAGPVADILDNSESHAGRPA